jgi:hypothetical protein
VGCRGAEFSSFVQREQPLHQGSDFGFVQVPFVLRASANVESVIGAHDDDVFHQQDVRGDLLDTPGGEADDQDTTLVAGAAEGQIEAVAADRVLYQPSEPLTPGGLGIAPDC